MIASHWDGANAAATAIVATGSLGMPPCRCNIGSLFGIRYSQRSSWSMTTERHGDLWPGNFLVDQDTCVIIDWEDVAIAHPFFSLAPLRVGLSQSTIAAPAFLDRLEHAYLVAYAEHASPERLRTALHIAAPLSFIDMAIRYRPQPPRPRLRRSTCEGVSCRGVHDSMGHEITEGSYLMDHIAPIKVISDSIGMSGVLQERHYGRTLSCRPCW
jgi:hypothetical protein